MARRLLLASTFALGVITTRAPAQSVSREACTGGSLVACVRVDLTATASAGNTSLMFAVSHLGVFEPLAVASQPSIIWSLAFAGGRDFDPDLIAEHEALVGSTGNAVLNDATPWTFVDYGDQWALMFPSWLDASFTTRGIGSDVVSSAPAFDAYGNPWQQMGTTGAGGAITFDVSLPYELSGALDWFQIIGLEAQGFEVDANDTRLGLAGSCSLEVSCSPIPPTSVPEPTTTSLIGAALLIGSLMRRHRALRGGLIA